MVNIDGRLEGIKRMVDRGNILRSTGRANMEKQRLSAGWPGSFQTNTLSFSSALKEWKMLFMKQRHPFASVSAVFYTVSCGIMKT